ncbi:hypothetical protein BG004_001195 [Podila humilis]|nr:hypothetical protein BG004_001195 [Podila humilis]
MKFTAILSVLAAATLVSAGSLHHPVSNNARVVPNGYIIEYNDNVKHSVARNALNSRKVDYKVRNEYNIFNGAAITVNSAHGGRDIANIPGVKNVWPIVLHEAPRTIKSNVKPTDPLATSLHHMTGMDVVMKKHKLTGKGVKVGIIDTGIDYKHPAFAAKGAKEGCFGRYGKNCRVTKGWDFVGDAYDGTNPPKPDSDPMDCQGHGTHVAGIVGGDARNIKVSPKPPQPFVGVAPDVTFGAYRVFGCDGSATSDVILAAMEMAFNDGMDLINMSLGGGAAYKYNPEAALSDKLAARGMAVAAAAGNDGTSGVWMVGNTGLGDLATSVASFDNAYGNYYTFTYTGAPTGPYDPSANYDKPIDLPGAKLAPLFNKDGTLADGCDAAIYTGLDVKGKVVLTLGDFTRCASGGRATIAKNAGAAGILVQTTPYGLSNLGGIADYPMASIEFQGGENLIAAHKKNPNGTFTWSKTTVPTLIEGGGSPSGFSSFGLDGELRSKPDIAAPGGAILSAYPLAKGGYSVLSGTSMATPYFAGAHAIYIQAKKSKPRGDVVRRTFKNTASVTTNFGKKTTVSAAKQGAGLINVLKAITTTTTIHPDHIDLLDTDHFQGTAKITIRNDGKRTETYTLSHVPADALNSYPDTTKTWPLGTPIVEADYATVAFSSSKVKIPAGKSVKVTLKFKEPSAGNAAHFPIYSGYVIATPNTKGGVAVQVPYTGMKGSISKVPIADRDLGYPRFGISNSTDHLISDEVSGDLVTDMKTQFPTILVRMGSHTPDRQIRVYNAAKTEFLGFVESHKEGSAFGYAGRNEFKDSDGNLAVGQWIWKGKVFPTGTSTAAIQLASGTYHIVVAHQFKFTKDAYPKNYEVYPLGNIKI